MRETLFLEVHTPKTLGKKLFGGKWTSKKMCSFPNLNILLMLFLIYPLAFRLMLQCGVILPVIQAHSSIIIQAIPIVKAHSVVQSHSVLQSQPVLKFHPVLQSHTFYRSITCALTSFFFELSHVIYLKLTIVL